MISRFQLDRVTGISVLVWILALIVVLAVLFSPKDAYTADQRTMVIQGVLFALGALTGYWLGSTEADRKRPLHPPEPIEETKP